MDKAVIESVKGRRHNGHPAIGHESYLRSEAVVANTSEPRMSLYPYDTDLQIYEGSLKLGGRAICAGYKVATAPSRNALRGRIKNLTTPMPMLWFSK